MVLASVGRYVSKQNMSRSQYHSSSCGYSVAFNKQYLDVDFAMIAPALRNTRPVPELCPRCLVMNVISPDYRMTAASCYDHSFGSYVPAVKMGADQARIHISTRH